MSDRNAALVVADVHSGHLSFFLLYIGLFAPSFSLFFISCVLDFLFFFSFFWFLNLLVSCYIDFFFLYFVFIVSFLFTCFVTSFTVYVFFLLLRVCSYVHINESEKQISLDAGHNCC